MPFFSHFDQPRLEAEVLLASLLDRERVWLKMHGDEPLGFLLWHKYQFWVRKRANGTPLAYVRGYQDWHGRRFVVNKDVLIPRDETETLLKHVLESSEQRAVSSILDLGTGSGCLAIELQRAIPGAEVLGLDISKSALKVANQNAQILLPSNPPTFRHSNLLGIISSDSHFDLIVANLPYVPADLEVMKEVRQEPHGAIFSGHDGLDHYRRLVQELDTKKITFEHLWIEFLPTQKDAIKDVFKDYRITFKADVAGNEFFALITAVDTHLQR